MAAECDVDGESRRKGKASHRGRQRWKESRDVGDQLTRQLDPPGP